jgi:transposase
VAELQAASDQVRAFAVMITQLTGQGLPQWITDARDAALPGISSFAKGLEQDIDAVTLGLTTRWNSVPVEGRVDHIKMIKRQMFGRAGLPLLPPPRPAHRPEPGLPVAPPTPVEQAVLRALDGGG